MSSLSPEIASLLYQALGSTYGIVVEVSDFARARARFYSTRKELADPNLEVLQFRQSPIAPDQIWIVKGGPVAAPQGAPDAPSEE